MLKVLERGQFIKNEVQMRDKGEREKEWERKKEKEKKCRIIIKKRCSKWLDNYTQTNDHIQQYNEIIWYREY